MQLQLHLCAFRCIHMFVDLSQDLQNVNTKKATDPRLPRIHIFTEM